MLAALQAPVIMMSQHRQAWAGALVLVGMVLLCSLLARIATRKLEGITRG